MTDALQKTRGGRPSLAAILILSLGSAGVAFAVMGLIEAVPPSSWFALLRSPDLADPAQIVAYFSLLPRIAAALLCGFALGLAGAIFQNVLRNPLAEPGLLGITSGAQLALAASLLFAPSLWQSGYELVALAGSAVAFGVILAAASGKGLGASAFVLTGVVVSLYCSAVYALLILFNHDYLLNLLAWQAGSMQQGGWQSVLSLLTQTGPVTLSILVLARPLRILSLGDGAARSLGLSPALLKSLLLALAAMLAAFVTAAVGLVGFVALAAPALARAAWPSGGRHPVVAACVGGMLLLFIDQLLRIVAPFAGDIPAGAAAGLFTGPLLVLLLLRNRQAEPPRADAGPLTSGRLHHPLRAIGLLCCLLLVAAAMSLLSGMTIDGWRFLSTADPWSLWRWRAPRILGAAGAGACLAVAGLLVQKAMRNPLASPELLGVGHGAGLALVLVFMLLPAGGIWSKFAISAAGAAAMLALVATLARRTAFQPERTLLIGVGLGAMVQALLILFLASGGPQGAALLSWFSGSMGAVRFGAAGMVAIVAVFALTVAMVCSRWVEILPLGDQAATAIGLPSRSARSVMLLVAAMATAAATMIVGPISFIGLMVPHLVALAGFRRAVDQLLASAFAGALLMVAADWIGRNLAWPWPMAPGLIAAMISGPFFFRLIRRGRLA